MSMSNAQYLILDSLRSELFPISILLVGSCLHLCSYSTLLGSSCTHLASWVQQWQHGINYGSWLCLRKWSLYQITNSNNRCALLYGSSMHLQPSFLSPVFPLHLQMGKEPGREGSFPFISFEQLRWQFHIFRGSNWTVCWYAQMQLHVGS